MKSMMNVMTKRSAMKKKKEKDKPDKLVISIDIQRNLSDVLEILAKRLKTAAESQTDSVYSGAEESTISKIHNLLLVMHSINHLGNSIVK